MARVGGFSKACSLPGREPGEALASARKFTASNTCIRQHMSAYVSIRQHTSAYVSMGEDVRHRGRRLMQRWLCCQLRCSSAVSIGTFVLVKQVNWVFTTCCAASSGSIVSTEKLKATCTSSLRPHTLGA